MGYVYIDTETTGLDPDRHEIWEVAAIVIDPTVPRGEEGHEQVYEWQLPVDLSKADPMALKISGFHDRYEVPEKELRGPHWERKETLEEFVDQFIKLTNGHHLVGAVVSFDEERLRRLARKHGQCPMWHYHLIDIEAMAVGYLLGRHGQEVHAEDEHGTFVLDPTSLPWKSDALSLACGVEPPSDDERHTALGDARWVKRWHEVLADV